MSTIRMPVKVVDSLLAMITSKNLTTTRFVELADTIGSSNSNMWITTDGSMVYGDAEIFVKLADMAIETYAPGLLDPTPITTSDITSLDRDTEQV